MAKDVLKNVMTFGAHGRIEAVLEHYKKAELEWHLAEGELELQRNLTNRSFENLVATKVSAVKRLKKLRQISKNISARQRAFSNATVDLLKTDVPLIAIDKTLSAAELAKNLAKGTSAGLSTALGAWALVGSFGTASTGTAIATLSGAAATNATLACLGGGALAAGGGGMAMGAAVLGGIALLPAFAVMGLFSHLSANKKIVEIEEANTKVVRAIASIKERTLSFNALQRRSEELNETIERSCIVFEDLHKLTRNQLFPWGFLSKIKRLWRLARGIPFFNDRDLTLLAPLLQVAQELAKQVDTKLIDEEGRVL